MVKRIAHCRIDKRMNTLARNALYSAEVGVLSPLRERPDGWICAPHLISAVALIAAPNGGSRSLPAATSGNHFDRDPRSRSAWPPMAAKLPSEVWAMELPCCPGDLGGDDVGIVSVQACACPVVAHRGARVRVRGRFLHVPQRDPGV
jgi:hypothetical protein